MITHGNKQISEIVYARKASEGGGAVRLTNIIRGAQVVFVGLYPNVKDWLEKATNAAILAAFGQTDGKAVIKATNAYLNAIAATDKSKASALAGFINEDPMLVCSLGLQPQGVQMPIRMLVGDGVAYIATNFKLQGKDSIRTTTYVPSTVSGNLTMWCSRDWSSTNIKTHTSFLMGETTSSLRYDYGDGISQQKDTGVNIPRNKPATIGTIKGDYYLNGTRLLTQPEITFEAGGGLYLYTSYTNTGLPPTNCVNGQGFSNFIDERDGDIAFGLLAMERNGVNGMIDYVSGTFYPNANTKGAFTINYRLSDGTPWTPLNQTP